MPEQRVGEGRRDEEEAEPVQGIAGHLQRHVEPTNHSIIPSRQGVGINNKKQLYTGSQ